jgi:preprotein translocase subunit YajC
MHMNCLNPILAQAAPPSNGQPGAQPNPLMSFLPMILLVVVFYFILIRPQQQRAKQQRKLLEALKSGDEVVTAAGIIGTVITVKDKTVTLRSGDAKFEVTKASVTELVVDASIPAKA